MSHQTKAIPFQLEIGERSFLSDHERVKQHAPRAPDETVYDEASSFSQNWQRRPIGEESQMTNHHSNAHPNNTNQYAQNALPIRSEIDHPEEQRFLEEDNNMAALFLSNPDFPTPMMLPASNENSIYAYIDHIPQEIMDANDPDSLLWFLRSETVVVSLSLDVEVPIIDAVFVDTSRRAALVLCVDEPSRNTLLCMSPFVSEFGIQLHLETVPNIDGRRTLVEQTQTILQNSNVWLQKPSLSPPGTAVWPGTKHVSSVKDETMRTKLCVFGRYKPPEWSTETVTAFLEHYFSVVSEMCPKYRVPTIASVWAYEGRSFVTIAFTDEVSRYNFLRLRVAYVAGSATHSKKGDEKTYMSFEGFQDFRGNSGRQDMKRKPMHEDSSRDGYSESSREKSPYAYNNTFRDENFRRGSKDRLYNDSKRRREGGISNGFLPERVVSRSRSRSPGETRSAVPPRSYSKNIGLQPQICQPSKVTHTEWPIGLQPDYAGDVEYMEDLKASLAVIAVDENSDFPSPVDPAMFLAHLKLALYLRAAQELIEVPVVEHLGLAYEFGTNAKIIVTSDIFSRWLLITCSPLNLQTKTGQPAMWLNLYPYSSAVVAPRNVSPNDFARLDTKVYGYPTWPHNLSIRDAPEEMRRSLCVTVLHKPLSWSEQQLLGSLNTIFDRLTLQFQSTRPRIASVMCSPGADQAYIAFEDEVSKIAALAMRVTYIQPDRNEGPCRPFITLAPYMRDSNQSIGHGNDVGVGHVLPPQLSALASFLRPQSFSGGAADAVDISSADEDVASAGDSEAKNDALLTALKSFASAVSKRKGT